MDEKIQQELRKLKNQIDTQKDEVLFIGQDKKDDNDESYFMVSSKLLEHLITSLEASQKENFNLKLEKTIWKYVPVDFADAWEVVMSEVKSKTSDNKESQASMNLNHLVKTVKKKHPNLFLNIDDFLPGDFQKIN